ncbi:MAG: hypothetical protein WKF71_03655 [Pyrinomonadaceae bacterium]
MTTGDAASSPTRAKVNTVDKNQLISLLQRLSDAGLDVIKTENLYNFDGAKGYSA